MLYLFAQYGSRKQNRVVITIKSRDKIVLQERSNASKSLKPVFYPEYVPVAKIKE